MEELSLREAEVLKLVGRHLSNPQIAEQLYISVRTVEGHVASLIRKLEVADRRALVAYATEGNRSTTEVLDPGGSSGLGAGAQSMPVGTVTFLLTDIEGSTRLWEADPAAMDVALSRHDRILREAIESHSGTVVTSRGEGDSFFAVFASAISALVAAGAAQRRLGAERWPAGTTIRVRMALHTGEGDLRNGEYRGDVAINRCARLRGAAHGDQVLVTRATRDLAAPYLRGGLEFHDLGEHRLRDLAAPEHIYQLAGQGLPTNLDPILTLERANNNLPVQLTSFVGRQEELARICELTSRIRIVTLIGAAGTGKSRLALQAAAEMVERFPDGAWLVELAALSDQRLVAQQVATALHQPELDLDRLRSKTLLILLDNCEHLIDGCAALIASLVQACPQIVVLATSREPLNITGELTLRIPPMDPADATRLFVERAELARPEQAITDQELPTVAAICDRLDGIPLAIELAAARVRGMAPAEILERLQDRFRLLTGHSRNALERHQTLRDAMAWSYDLLDSSEQTLFRQLSVFSGGWRLTSAEAVCGVGLSDGVDISDLVLTLVDKSLVLVDSQRSSRYRMLETLRQFGQDELDEAGERPELERRHGEHFLSLAASADWPTETWWLDPRVADVAEDLDNIRAALEWSRADRPEVHLGLVVGAAPLWVALGRFAEGKSALIEALERSPGPSEQRFDALERLGWLSALQSDLQTAERTATEMLALSRSLERQALAKAQTLHGFVALQLREYERAGELLAESLPLYSAVGNLAGIAQVRHHQATIAQRTGDSQRAEALFDEVIVIARQTGDAGLITYALLSAIPLLVAEGRIADARQRWQDAHRNAIGQRLTILSLALLGYGAAIAATEARPRRAVVLTKVALRLQVESGWVDDALLEWFWETLAPAYGELDPEALAEADEVGDQLSIEAALAYAASDED